MTELTDIQKLKFNLQETQMPYFSDAELQNLLDIYGELWTASYYGCIMKAQSNDQIELPGGLKMPSNSAYWFALAGQYKDLIPTAGADPNSDSIFPAYKTYMSRVDGQ